MTRLYTRVLTFVLTLTALVCPTHAFAQTALPQGFSTEVVADGMPVLIALDFASDKRMFVGAKDGRVYVIENGVRLYPPFADLRPTVNNIFDRGLLGLAVHPEFPEQPYIYISLVYDPPQTATNTGLAGVDGGGNRVARVIRLQADPAFNHNRSLPNSETVLLGSQSTWENIGEPDTDFFTDVPSCQTGDEFVNGCIPVDSNSHSVGGLDFGLDGSLYITTGDGSRAAGGTSPFALRAQRFDSLTGKILRIHPLTGEAYADNPFFDGDFNTNRSKIWGLGFRNPFRITTHPDDGEIYIGDVGWGAWEEVNRAGVATGGGRNFGWPCFEGANGVSAIQSSYSFLTGCVDLLNNGLMSQVTAPSFAYDHSGGLGASIILGDFYTGESWPAPYRGSLFYTDFNRKTVRYLSLNASGDIVADNDFATNTDLISQIKSGPDTNLYYTALDGAVRRIIYTAGGNTPPTASFTASPSSGPVPLNATFDASASFDPDGDALTYVWSFGDGSSATGVSAAYNYSTAGNFVATLTVEDSNGAASQTSQTISVGNAAPLAQITSLTNGGISGIFVIGDTVEFTGTGFDTEDGALSGAALTWNVLVNHNDHQHLDYFNGSGTGGSFEFLDHEDNSSLEVCLTATDSAGLTDTTCQLAEPATIDLTIDSNPPGLTLTYGDITGVTPFTVNPPTAGIRSIGAPTTQQGLTFESWSDGGAAVHDISVPATATTLTANYSGNPGGVACGRPTYTPGGPNPVVALWQVCGTNQWLLETSDGSASPEPSEYRGSLVNTPALNFTQVETQLFEGIDTLNGVSSNGPVASASTLEFVMRMNGVGIDRIAFTAPTNAMSCLAFSQTPVTTVLVGANNTPATVPFDLATLEACSPDTPDIDLSIADITVSESIGVASATITLSGPAPAGGVSVTVSSSDGSATSSAPDNDYTAVSTNVSIAAGDTTAVVSIAIINDSRNESTETFMLTLSDPVGASIGDATAIVSISDDDSQVVCGQPIYAPGGLNPAIALWQDCTTSQWSLEMVDGSAIVGPSDYTGTLTASPATNFNMVSTTSFEGIDQVNGISDNGAIPPAAKLDFTVRMNGAGYDRINFMPASGTSTCLEFSTAPTTTVLVGGNATPATLPFDIETLQPCNQPELVCGAPTYTRVDTAPAVALWKDCGTGVWTLAMMDDVNETDPSNYSGSLTSTPATNFSAVSTTSFEGIDQVNGVFDNGVIPPAQTLNFVTRMFGNGVDSLLFAPAANADACLAFTQSEVNQVLVGATGIPITPPFSVETLGACQ